MPSLPSQPFAAFHTSFSTLAKNFAAASLRCASVQFVLVWFGLAWFCFLFTQKIKIKILAHTQTYMVYMFSFKSLQQFKNVYWNEFMGYPLAGICSRYISCRIWLETFKAAIITFLFILAPIPWMSELVFKEQRQSTHIKCRTSEFGIRRSINCKLPAHKSPQELLKN